MEPKEPPILMEPEPEEPLEVLDYYEAMRGGYLGSEEEGEAE